MAIILNTSIQLKNEKDTVTRSNKYGQSVSQSAGESISAPLLSPEQEYANPPARVNWSCLASKKHVQ